MSVHIKSLVFVLVVYILFSGFTAIAVEPSENKMEQFRAILIISKSVGFAMTGEKSELHSIPIKFVRPVKKVPLFVKNDFKLFDILLTQTSSEQIKGVFTFKDTYQRKIIHDFEIHYKQSDSGLYNVVKTVSEQIEPLSPDVQIYFVPKEKIGTKKAEKMDMVQLLRFARENTDRVIVGTENAPVKSYEVLVFCMDRLGPDARIKLYSGNQNSDSWELNGWHIAKMTSEFAVNDEKETRFYVFHQRGKGPVDPGKVYMAGAFSNQYVPPDPPGPTVSREIPQEIKEIKTKFDSNVFQSLNR